MTIGPKIFFFGEKEGLQKGSLALASGGQMEHVVLCCMS